MPGSCPASGQATARPGKTKSSPVTGTVTAALSSHDSTPWPYGAFAHRFGDRYRTRRIGEELRISAGGVRAVAPGGPASNGA
jgi:hypothetical protein